MTKTVTLLALTLLVAAVPAPLLAQSRQEQQMAAELRMLQEQQQQLALAQAQLAEQFKAMNPRFDELAEAFRKRMADLEQTVKNMGTDLSAIRAQTQDTGTRLGRLADEVDAIHKAIAAMPAEIIRLLPVAPPAPFDPNAPPGAVSQGPALTPPQAPPASSIAGLSPGRLLDQAMSDYYAGQFGAAISGFETVIRNFPGSPTAAEAQFHMGESYTQEKRYPQAIAAYNALIQMYPTSPRVPDAYYKRGFAQESAGQLEEALTTFELAMKNYGDTAPGQRAKQGFDRITLRLKTAKPK
jgi:tol-pal system protein YbgF